MPTDTVPIDIVALQVKEIRLVTVFRYANVYDRAIALLTEGKINVKPLISATYDFNESIEAFSRADPLKLAFCWAHGRRKLIKATPKSGSPIVDEALVRIAALYKIEDSIRGSDPEHRRAVRQDLSLPLVDEFFTWLTAQAKRVSRKSDLGKALAYMLTRQDGFRLFLDGGHVDIDSNLVENAIRRPAMNRRNALFAGHDEGGRIGPGLPA